MNSATAVPRHRFIRLESEQFYGCSTAVFVACVALGLCCDWVCGIMRLLACPTMRK